MEKWNPESLEPSPLSSLSHRRRIPVHFLLPWIDSNPAQRRSYPVELEPNPRYPLPPEEASWGSESSRAGSESESVDPLPPLQYAQIVNALLASSSIPVSQLADAFPAACEYFNNRASLQFSFQREHETSRWEGLCKNKQVLVTISAVNMRSNESIQALKIALSKMRNPTYRHTIKRILLLGGQPEENISSLPLQYPEDSAHLRVLPRGVDLTKFCSEIMREVGANVVRYLTCRIPSLLAVSPNDAALFVTPLDKAARMHDEGALELQRRLFSRSSKHRADSFLQLGALDSALKALEGIGAQGYSPDTLWQSAALEVLASVRHAASSEFFRVHDEWQRKLRPNPGSELATSIPDKDLAVMDDLITEVTTSFRKAGSARDCSLSLSARSVFQIEIDSPTQPALQQCHHLISILRGESVGSATPQELADALTVVEEFIYREIDHYLTEAAYSYKKLSSQSQVCLILECELLLSLISFRAERRRPSKVLICITYLQGLLRKLPAEAAQRVARAVPYACWECGGMNRKAVLFLRQAALEDCRSGNYPIALRLLLQAASWCGVPLALDFHHGRLSLTSPKQAANEDVGGAKRVQVNLLLDMAVVSKHLFDHGQDCGLRAHLISYILFRFHTWLDSVAQGVLFDALKITSHALPLHASPSIVSPPIVNSAALLPLPSHLAPTLQHVAGVKFTFNNIAPTKYFVNGKCRTSPVVWVAGEAASVEVVFRNPFHDTLLLTSVSLRCRLDATAQPAPYMTTYLVRGVVLPPQHDVPVCIRAMSPVNGTVFIDGVDVHMGQTSFGEPLFIPFPLGPIEVPVLQALPTIQCSLSVTELHIFTGQQVPLRANITNTGMLPVETVGITFHHGLCETPSCDGCAKGNSPAEYSSILLQPAGGSAVSWTTPLPIASGESTDAMLRILAPLRIAREKDDKEKEKEFPTNGGKEPQAPRPPVVSETTLLVRVAYGFPITVPDLPANLLRSSEPVYAPILRRTYNSALRLHLHTSIELIGVDLSTDRRFVVVQLRNASPKYAIVLKNSNRELAPFDCDYDVVCQPMQIMPLRYFISRMSPELSCILLEWMLMDFPCVNGALPISLAPVKNSMNYTEPLEDAALRFKFHLNTEEEQEGGPDVGPVTWDCTSAPSSPLVFPAVKPVQVDLTVEAPWREVVEITVAVKFEENDTAMLAGPVVSHLAIGSGMGVTKQFTMRLFSAGEHSLTVILTDKHQRTLKHSVHLVAEHEA